MELTSDRGAGAGRSAGEVALAIGILLATSPVLLVASVLIKLTSAGPVLYTQTRLGHHGRCFTIYKLRTMRHGCEAVSGPCWSAPGDSRVTWIGAVLRRTHLDELPQLWNVIRGDMALIGPRPERPEIAIKLARTIPNYYERLRVRPGLTGLAQIQLPPDTTLESVRRKLRLDLAYIHERGPGLDLRILIGTALHLGLVPHPTIRRVLRLPAADLDLPRASSAPV